MEEQTRRPLYVAGIIEGHDNHLLIVLPKGSTGTSRQWQFPRGRAKAEESPEAAMRRMAEEDLGIKVEIVVGQSPLATEVDSSVVELRYFICGVVRGELKTGPYSETRWVPKGHLREYELDKPSQPVASWLLESR
jgi:8-oxo-dGTP pyrophosphatase MutT (NUDIX family)